MEQLPQRIGKILQHRSHPRPSSQYRKLLWLVKPGPRTQYRVWLAVLGLAVLLPAWGIRRGKVVAAPNATFSARFDELATARIVQRSAGVVAVDATAPLMVDSVPVTGEETATGIWRLPSRVRRVHLPATVTHWVMGVYVGSVLLGLLRVARAWRGARGLVEVSREVALCSAAETVLRDLWQEFRCEFAGGAGVRRGDESDGGGRGVAGGAAAGGVCRASAGRGKGGAAA